MSEVSLCKRRKIVSMDSIASAPLAERIAKAPRRLTVYEYHELVNVGLLHEDDRVELIGGRLVAMEPIGSRHFSVVTELHRLLVRSVGERARVGVDAPIELSDDNEPQPDLALLRPRADRYFKSLPRAADVLLLIEVADSSLRYDRTEKMRLYAKHGIPEYWVVDVELRRLTVFLDPGEDGYRTEKDLDEGVIRAALVPEVEIRLQDLFI